MSSDEDASRSPPINGALAGVRILIVEDEFLLAMALEQDLLDAGALVVGPFHNIAEAMEAIQRDVFDMALLDVNLRGDHSYPLADELTQRKIPFMFMTGYSARDLPERYRDFPKLSKPHYPAQLVSELARLRAATAASGGVG